MKNNDKGFTLIELLAVIVILAIIALITTPIILNLIENSRKSAAENKAYGVIDAVRLAYTQDQISVQPVVAKLDENGDNIIVTTFQNEDGRPIQVTFGNTTDPEHTSQLITVTGSQPVSGNVTVNMNTGTISAQDLKFEGDRYKCNVDVQGTASCEQDKDNS